MTISRFVVSGFTAGIMALGVGSGYAQDYPTRPIRFITAGVGGPTETAARIIGQAISGPLGQPVVVENRPGGVILGETVSKAAPDGYTLLVTGGTLWMGGLLQPTPYDPIKDFSPITLATVAPQLLVVHPSIPKTVKGLIALAKARPGELNYGSGSTGGTSHLMGELFNQMAGIKIVRVPYKSDAAELVDHVTGQIQLQFNSAPAVMPSVKSGKLVLIGITSPQPSPLYPDVSTIAATLPGYEAENWNTIFAPAKTPAAIINRLNQEIVRYLKTPEANEKFALLGAKPVASSPQELTAAITADMVKWARLIKDARITAN